MVLYRFHVSGRKQLVLPQALQHEFLEQLHANPINGAHFGVKRTKFMVRQRVYFVGWAKTTELFVNNCIKCQRYIRGPLPHHGELQMQQSMEDSQY